MSLFQTPEPTEQERAKDMARTISNVSQRALTEVKNSVTQSFYILWKSGVDPQEILNVFGTSAKDLFIASQEAQAFVAKFDPEFVALETPYEFTINQDGTITLGVKKEEQISPDSI